MHAMPCTHICVVVHMNGSSAHNEASCWTERAWKALKMPDRNGGIDRACWAWILICCSQIFEDYCLHHRDTSSMFGQTHRHTNNNSSNWSPQPGGRFIQLTRNYKSSLIFIIDQFSHFQIVALVKFNCNILLARLPRPRYVTIPLDVMYGWSGI